MGYSTAAGKARGVYQAGFNRRYASVYRALKQRIEDGLTPGSALLKMNRGELQRPAWTGDPAISGGFLYETPVHMLDMARHLFGEPADVIVRARSSVYEQLDDFSMLLTFASGMTATLAASAHATWLPPFERVEVYGDHAIAVTEEMERITYASGVETAVGDARLRAATVRRALGLRRGRSPIRRRDLRRRPAGGDSAGRTRDDGFGRLVLPGGARRLI